METETFTHAHNDSPNFIKVSDIYDTFILLDRMNDISSKVDDQQKARRYIDAAKRLNAILQGYTVSEVYINNCSLKQAEIVFARINSKGTGIAKTDMLQAMSYKNGDVLFSDRIKEIQSEIAKYGFRTISKENLLKCFYRYAGKDFYDAKPEDLEHLDFGGQTPQIKDCIVKSVMFLHDECHVLDSRLLPYINQLVAMTWFFKDHPSVNTQQSQALKRWFYYTTYNQVFMNSSLKNVRRLFRRFEMFVNDSVSEAYDYETIQADNNYHFKFSLRNARTDFLVLACINERMKSHKDEELFFSGIFNLQMGDRPHYGFINYNEDTRTLINSALIGSLPLASEDIFSGNAINQELIDLYRNGDYSRFESERESLFFGIECELLKSLKLDL